MIPLLREMYDDGDHLLSFRELVWFNAVPIALFAFGGVFVSIMPNWLMLTIYTPGLILLGIGVLLISHRWRQWEEAWTLEDIWRKQRERGL